MRPPPYLPSGLDRLIGRIDRLLGRRSRGAGLVDTTSRGGSLRVYPALDSPERVFEKVVRLAGPADISMVWVDGGRVVG